MDRLGAAKHVLEDVGAVEPGREIGSVADVSVDEGVVVDLVERRHIGIAAELADFALATENSATRVTSFSRAWR